MIRVGPIASAPPKPAYAPASPTMRTRMPTIVPSRLQPSSTYCTCPRPWGIAIRFSERVSIHFTGRCNRRAAATATVCSGPRPGLPPNAPPVWGAITRTAPTSNPKIGASLFATPCGICVDTYTVSS